MNPDEIVEMVKGSLDAPDTIQLGGPSDPDAVPPEVPASFSPPDVHSIGGPIEEVGINGRSGRRVGFEVLTGLYVPRDNLAIIAGGTATHGNLLDQYLREHTIAGSPPLDMLGFKAAADGSGQIFVEIPGGGGGLFQGLTRKGLTDDVRRLKGSIIEPGEHLYECIYACRRYGIEEDALVRYGHLVSGSADPNYNTTDTYRLSDCYQELRFAGHLPGVLPEGDRRRSAPDPAHRDIGMEAPDTGGRPEAAFPEWFIEGAERIEAAGYDTVQLQRTGSNYVMDVSDMQDLPDGTIPREIATSFVVNQRLKVGVFTVRLPAVAKSTGRGFATDEKVKRMARAVADDMDLDFDTLVRVEVLLKGNTLYFAPHIEPQGADARLRFGDVVTGIERVPDSFRKHLPLAYGGGEGEQLSAPPQIPDEDLLDDLRDVAATVDGSLTTAEYDERGEYSAQTMIRRFGSWNEAKEAAGLFTSFDAPGQVGVHRDIEMEAPGGSVPTGHDANPAPREDIESVPESARQFTASEQTIARARRLARLDYVFEVSTGSSTTADREVIDFLIDFPGTSLRMPENDDFRSMARSSMSFEGGEINRVTFRFPPLSPDTDEELTREWMDADDGPFALPTEDPTVFGFGNDLWPHVDWNNLAERDGVTFEDVLDRLRGYRDLYVSLFGDGPSFAAPEGGEVAKPPEVPDGWSPPRNVRTIDDPEMTAEAVAAELRAESRPTLNALAYNFNETVLLGPRYVHHDQMYDQLVDEASGMGKPVPSQFLPFTATGARGETFLEVPSTAEGLTQQLSRFGNTTTEVVRVSDSADDLYTAAWAAALAGLPDETIVRWTHEPDVPGDLRSMIEGTDFDVRRSVDRYRLGDLYQELRFAGAYPDISPATDLEAPGDDIPPGPGGRAAETILDGIREAGVTSVSFTPELGQHLIEFHPNDQDPHYPSAVTLDPDTGRITEVTLRFGPLGDRAETPDDRIRELEGKWVDVVLDAAAEVGITELFDKVGAQVDFGDAWVAEELRPHVRLHERDDGYDLAPQSFVDFYDEVQQRFRDTFGSLEDRMAGLPNAEAGEFRMQAPNDFERRARDAEGNPVRFEVPQPGEAIMFGFESRSRTGGNGWGVVTDTDRAGGRVTVAVDTTDPRGEPDVELEYATDPAEQRIESATYRRLGSGTERDLVSVSRVVPASLIRRPPVEVGDYVKIGNDDTVYRVEAYDRGRITLDQGFVYPVTRVTAFADDVDDDEFEPFEIIPGGMDTVREAMNRGGGGPDTPDTGPGIDDFNAPRGGAPRRLADLLRERGFENVRVTQSPESPRTVVDFIAPSFNPTTETREVHTSSVVYAPDGEPKTLTLRFPLLDADVYDERDLFGLGGVFDNVPLVETGMRGVQVRRARLSAGWAYHIERGFGENPPSPRELADALTETLRRWESHVSEFEQFGGGDVALDAPADVPPAVRRGLRLMDDFNIEYDVTAFEDNRFTDDFYTVDVTFPQIPDPRVMEPPVVTSVKVFADGDVDEYKARLGEVPENLSGRPGDDRDALLDLTDDIADEHFEPLGPPDSVFVRLQDRMQQVVTPHIIYQNGRRDRHAVDFAELAQALNRGRAAFLDGLEDRFNLSLNRGGLL